MTSAASANLNEDGLGRGLPRAADTGASGPAPSPDKASAETSRDVAWSHPSRGITGDLGGPLPKPSSAARHHRLSDAHAEAWLASHNRPPTRDKVSYALRVLDDAIAEWQPETVYALFSGGGDSIVAAHIASRHPRFNGCVFIDTGTALPGVREHVVAICEREGWKLWVARSSESYEDMIREHGLPGPGQHPTAYVRLKEKALDAFVRFQCLRCPNHGGEHDRIVWVSGARSVESVRRMRNATKFVERDGSQVWVNVILDWTAETCAAYRELWKLPLSEWSSLIHRSGECQCGTMAHDGERAMLRALSPEFAVQMDAWEDLALENGHHYAATWGQRPLKVHADQVQLIPRGRALACADCEKQDSQSVESLLTADDLAVMAEDAVFE